MKDFADMMTALRNTEWRASFYVHKEVVRLQVQSHIQHSRNLILIEWTIYKDVIEFADLHPTKCVQQQSVE